MSAHGTTEPPKVKDSDYRAIFESAPNLNLVLTPDLTVVAATDDYLTATMKRREDVIGRYLFDVFPDDPQDPGVNGVRNLRASLERVVATGHSDMMAVQYYPVRKPVEVGEGFEKRWWVPTNSPVFSKDGRLLYIVHRVDDVTTFMQELDRTREHVDHCSAALEETRHQLAAANQNMVRLVRERTAVLASTVRDLQNFSYALTHDLRAPLRAVHGIAELLEEHLDGKLDAEARALMGRITTSVRRMDRLVVDALDYSKALQEQVSLSPVDTDGLVRHMVATYSEFQMPSANVEVRGKLPKVLGNEAALTQCFSHLLQNAVKFVKPGMRPEVKVWSEERDGHARIFVEDNGIGIRKAHQQRIFDLFERQNTNVDGTGLGLALVSKLMERMNGMVGVESEEGRGSRFWIQLPVATPAG